MLTADRLTFRYIVFVYRKKNEEEYLLLELIFSEMKEGSFRFEVELLTKNFSRKLSVSNELQLPIEQRKTKVNKSFTNYNDYCHDGI